MNNMAVLDGVIDPQWLYFRIYVLVALGSVRRICTGNRSHRRLECRF